MDETFISDEWNVIIGTCLPLPHAHDGDAAVLLLEEPICFGRQEEWIHSKTYVQRNKLNVLIKSGMGSSGTSLSPIAFFHYDAWATIQVERLS